MGFINATKVPDNDLIQYYKYFDLAGQYNFFDYVSLKAKEPAFYAITYIMYYITLGSETAYVAAITFCAYFFLLYAVLKYYKYIFDDSHVIAFALIIVAFLPQLFSMSAHLIRQFLGGGIFFLALVNYLFYDKKSWFLVLLAVFIHSTVLLFVPFMYLKIFKGKKSILSICIYVLCMMVMFNYSQQISTSVLNILGDNVITYPFKRFGQKTYYDLKDLSVMGYVVFGVLVVVVSFVYSNKKLFIGSQGHSPIYQFCNIFIVLVIFIILNISESELSVRYFVYVYMFVPFIFPLIILEKNNVAFLTRISISILSIVYFVYKLKFGVWDYADLSVLLYSSVINFVWYF